MKNSDQSSNFTDTDVKNGWGIWERLSSATGMVFGVLLLVGLVLEIRPRKSYHNTQNTHQKHHNLHLLQPHAIKHPQTKKDNLANATKKNRKNRKNRENK